MSITKVLACALVVCLIALVASVVLSVAGAAGFVRGKVASLAPKAVPRLVTLFALLGIAVLIALALKVMT